MSEYEIVVTLLPVVIKMDKRLYHHTLSEVDSGCDTKHFEHIDLKCPLCQAIWLLDKYGYRII